MRSKLRKILVAHGFNDGSKKQGDADQVTDVRLAQELLRAFKDPDHYFGEWWAKGVWLGSPERPLPRTPSLYDRKTKWSIKGEGEVLHGEWSANYSSLKEHEPQVLKQYKAEIEDDLMEVLSLGEALERFGENLLIVATGAISKKGSGPGGEVRVIFDGTNGVYLNYGIRVRDQIRLPAAPDIKAMLAELHSEGGTRVTVLFDVSKAHRRVPVLEEEWGRQACQVRGSAAATAQAKKAKAARTPGSEGSRPPSLTRADFTPKELAEDVYINKVGTFGVSSAGYWWGRAGGALMRLGHYFVGMHDSLYALLYSDDGMLTGRTDYPDIGILSFLLVLMVVKLPLSWKKVKGGDQVEWIGYALDLARFEMGVSVSRAAWAAKWLEDKATEGSVRLGELKEGLGRLQFLAGPVEYIRPFLGPLYAWASIGQKFLRPKLPVMILLIMKYLAVELKGDHMMACEAPAKHLGELFRLDAKAENGLVAIGGWKIPKSGRSIDAEWFALELTRATAPWAFARGEPFRTIASLELLGTLVSLVVFYPETDRKGDAAGLISMTCSTDNQGNSFLLDKLLTTRYPLGVVLMELAHQMKKRRVVLRARWLPRLQNQEADDLTNFELRHFDPKKRIQVDINELGLDLMHSLFEVGDSYMADLEKLKAEDKLKVEAKRAKGGRLAGPKGKKLKSLRETQPW